MWTIFNVLIGICNNVASVSRFGFLAAVLAPQPGIESEPRHWKARF